MMTSREIVQRTLEFSGPERVARSFSGADFVGAGPQVETPATDWSEVGGGRWERTDEWGNRWGRVDPTSKGEVIQGALPDLAKLDHFAFPDFSKPESYDPVRNVRAEHPDMYLLGGLHGFAFNIARKLRKLEQYFVDLLIEPERIHELHDRIDALNEDMLRNYAAAGVDGVMVVEDWGTQAELLIDPALWRAEFGPRIARFCSLAHELGVTVWLHSCGQIESVMPDMIDAGIDLFQFDQPELHGIDRLASHQDRAKVTFWCPVDIQKTLQTKDETRIRAQARELLDKLWQGRGGFMAGFYGDNASIGLDPKWQDYACDEFIRHGVRERYVTQAQIDEMG